MVVISHDRAFLDQLCTKMVETDMGASKTYEGNYSQYILAKEAWVEAQNAAWEKQQKEIEQTKDLINRLGAGANAGRASTAEKVSLHMPFFPIFISSVLVCTKIFTVIVKGLPLMDN